MGWYTIFKNHELQTWNIIAHFHTVFYFLSLHKMNGTETNNSQGNSMNLQDTGMNLQDNLMNLQDTGTYFQDSSINLQNTIVWI